MKKSTTFLVSLLISVACLAQTEKVMTIGDNAPELQYSKWIKGTPFTPDQKDMVYVFEFWATWCGPCIGSMPHLSDLADKFQGKAEVIGVNVWEKTKGEPYETSIPSVEKFVESNGDNMRYNVVIDNNEQHMGNKWLFAAGQKGIPSTIVVKNGVIQWIGHPMSLDGPLDSLVNGTYDIASAKLAYTQRQLAGNERMAQMERIFKAVDDAVEAKDFEGIDRAVAEGSKEVPNLKGALMSRKFMALLNHKSSNDAFLFAEEALKEVPQFKPSFAMMTLEQDNLAKDDYLKAIAWLEQMPDTNSMVLNLIANGYEKAGDFDRAIETMEKAVAQGQEELKDEKFQGRIFDHTIQEYKDKIKTLQMKQAS